ncbi:hypothetical protein P153DRAFT_367362 [Dothidotthia symphoricarpi CBS 119687]|uniref:Uncharacterized protein n=1 Tax=Dothidotthia symphoricarpi CBS 119687 TaxID=1392245 RepID=A0A6A6ABW9_9PLEO|nr:uncharacterized protein P153DRAFT_367362 [Dothidotthia symphoricarpi CBS 119687]KAF2129086.1 hypothetical protein P153DRAFT_367362 [Dothidotthia symphoricarpi CBS 119687]
MSQEAPLPLYLDKKPLIPTTRQNPRLHPAFHPPYSNQTNNLHHTTPTNPNHSSQSYKDRKSAPPTPPCITLQQTPPTYHDLPYKYKNTMPPIHQPHLRSSSTSRLKPPSVFRYILILLKARPTTTHTDALFIQSSARSASTTKVSNNGTAGSYFGIEAVLVRESEISLPPYEP